MAPNSAFLQLLRLPPMWGCRAEGERRNCFLLVVSYELFFGFEFSRNVSNMFHEINGLVIVWIWAVPLLTVSLLCGGGVEDTPSRGGAPGRHGTESGGPLVTLNLCVMRRCYVGEGGLLSTSPPSFLSRATAVFSEVTSSCFPLVGERG